MWEWMRAMLRRALREIELTRETFNSGWRTTTNRPLTKEEVAAVDRAFEKFAEGFRELDKAFGDWKW